MTTSRILSLGHEQTGISVRRRRAEQTAAPNPAMKPRFQIESPWRGFGEPWR